MTTNDTAVDVTYAIGREKIREWALAVGELSALHHDPEAARAAGFPDVVAPPMFAAVYQRPAIVPFIAQADLGRDGQLIHGAQEFAWGRLVCAGEAIRTTARLAEQATTPVVSFVIVTRSHAEDGSMVCAGRWTLIRLPRSR